MLGVSITVIIAVLAVIVACLLSIFLIWFLMLREARNNCRRLEPPLFGKRFSTDNDNGWKAPVSDDVDPLQFYYYITDTRVSSPSIATPPPAYASKLNSPTATYSFLPPGSLWEHADSQTRPSLAFPTSPVASPALEKDKVVAFLPSSSSAQTIVHPAPEPAHTSVIRRPAYPQPPIDLTARSPTLSLRTSFAFSSPNRPSVARLYETPLTADAYPDGSEPQPFRTIPRRSQRPRRPDFTKAWLSSIPNDTFDQLQEQQSATNACILDPSARRMSRAPSSPKAVPLGPSSQTNSPARRHRNHSRKREGDVENMGGV